jgi:putative transposase
VTVKRLPLGEYYIILSIEAEGKPIRKTHNGASVGIDFGLKTYMTLSDGKRIQSPRFLKKGMNAKKKADRRMSRCMEGSNHRKLARKAKNRIEERITNQRDAWQWEKAHKLCRKYDIICIEDLLLTGMTKLWGRKMQDLAHGKMIAKLEYLAPRYGVTVKKIDRYYPSSKLCDCGHIHNSLSLHDREWTCPVCGAHHDRDLHAANNILRQGIASLGSPGKTRKPAVVTVRGRKHPRISRL